MCHSLPFSCRKTMAVHWFARNMSVKSSSVWASKGQNAPHRSLRFLLTLLSTLSGYTKCSNFTPVWTGTDGRVWTSSPYMTSPQPARGGAALGPQIPRPLQHGPQGRNEENHLMESGHFGILWLNLSFDGDHRLVIEEWINQMESHPFFCFANEDIQVVSLNIIFTTKVSGTWTAY